MLTALIYCFTLCVMCALLAFQTWVEHLHDLNSRYTLEKQPDEKRPVYTLEDQERDQLLLPLE